MNHLRQKNIQVLPRGCTWDSFMHGSCSSRIIKLCHWFQGFKCCITSSW
jgi:hypothetical protein